MLKHMKSEKSIQIEALDEQRFAPFGQMLGTPFPKDPKAIAYGHPGSDFWHVHDFNPGEGGTTEVLWVNYRNANLRVTGLEVHWLTEQAIIPLGSGLVHVVCPGREDGSRLPDLSGLRAFKIELGQGICMRAGCWHASFVLAGQVTCMMLTRHSTTQELVAHLARGSVAAETSMVELAGLDEAEWWLTT